MAKINWYNILLPAGLVMGAIAGYRYSPKVIEFIHNNIIECSGLVKFAAENEGLCRAILGGATAVGLGALTHSAGSYLDRKAEERQRAEHKKARKEQEKKNYPNTCSQVNKVR